MRPPLLPESCGRRGDEWFSVTMVVSFGAITAILSAARVIGVYPCPQSGLVAIAAPSTIAPSFLNEMSGSSLPYPAKVPKPQSLPAIMHSRPAMSATGAVPGGVQ